MKNVSKSFGNYFTRFFRFFTWNKYCMKKRLRAHLAADRCIIFQQRFFHTVRSFIMWVTRLLESHRIISSAFLARNSVMKFELLSFFLSFRKRNFGSSSMHNAHYSRFMLSRLNQMIHRRAWDLLRKSWICTNFCPLLLAANFQHSIVLNHFDFDWNYGYFVLLSFLLCSTNDSTVNRYATGHWPIRTRVITSQLHCINQINLSVEWTALFGHKWILYCLVVSMTARSSISQKYGMR